MSSARHRAAGGAPGTPRGRRVDPLRALIAAAIGAVLVGAGVVFVGTVVLFGAAELWRWSRQRFEDRARPR